MWSAFWVLENSAATGPDWATAMSCEGPHHTNLPQLKRLPDFGRRLDPGSPRIGFSFTQEPFDPISRVYVQQLSIFTDWFMKCVLEKNWKPAAP